uniref:MORN repeat-containing protein 5 n=1 Tax=Guillardia theta TaxID=55529 RepID=A0A7S4L5Z7_GUITH|mmetsp:Transcript_38206/g.120320  ORF Transcript_38206/g.120320 Transcript_38206/m.120320 type:complete len:184 (+) Transcript_38206:170-721(+)
MEAKECASGDIFHYVCYTTSRRHQKKFKDMKKSLNSLILDVSRDPGGSSLPGSRKQMLLSLLAQALKYGVTTEIARNDLDVNTASILQDTLIGIREKEKQHSEYNDIMLFPGTSRLLYRGSFLGLRFEGQGEMYYRKGDQVAYKGSWRRGRMHGYGTLYGSEGGELWSGYFEEGRPMRPWWVV